MRTLTVLIVLLALGAGGAWYFAGRTPGPVIEIAQPTKVIGQTGELVVDIDTHGGRLALLNIALEQNGRRTPLFSLPGDNAAQLTREGDQQIRVSRYGINTAPRPLMFSPATMSATRATPRSIIVCFPKSFAKAASRSMIASCRRSCRRSCRIPPHCRGRMRRICWVLH